MADHNKVFASTTHIDCSTDINLHTVSYTWTIKNFHFHEAKAECVKSSRFSAVGNDRFEWFLEMYPNGYDRWTDADAGVSAVEKKVSVFIIFAGKLSNGQKVFGKLRLSVLNALNKEIFSYEDDDDGVFWVERSNRSYGETDFLPKDDHFRKNLLSNNSLTIHCDLTFSEMNDISNTVHKSVLSIAKCKLNENIASLFGDDQFADIILSANGTDFAVHKTILVARSSVFAAMFKHNTQENKQNRIIVEDIKEDVMREVLRYIYTGECERLDTLAAGLLAAADKYDLEELKMACAQVLIENVSVKNAARILYLSDMHNANELKSKTIAFIVSKFAEMQNTDDWKHIVMSNPHLLNDICVALHYHTVARMPEN